MNEIQIKKPSTYISAILLSLPNTALIWFVIMYPVYGITGEVLHPFFHILTCTVIYLIVCTWALFGSDETSEVIYRTCRFGSILALLLPVSTGIVSLSWALSDAGRPDAFLTGFTALEIPVYAAAAALLIIILSLTGSYLAARHMDGIPF